LGGFHFFFIHKVLIPPKDFLILHYDLIHKRYGQ
jgi:hypothetical protein